MGFRFLGRLCPTLLPFKPRFGFPSSLVCQLLGTKKRNNLLNKEISQWFLPGIHRVFERQWNYCKGYRIHVCDKHCQEMDRVSFRLRVLLFFSISFVPMYVQILSLIGLAPVMSIPKSITVTRQALSWVSPLELGLESRVGHIPKEIWGTLTRRGSEWY